MLLKKVATQHPDTPLFPVEVASLDDLCILLSIFSDIALQPIVYNVPRVCEALSGAKGLGER